MFDLGLKLKQEKEKVNFYDLNLKITKIEFINSQFNINKFHYSPCPISVRLVFQMISGSNYGNKIHKQKSLHDKIGDKSQKQVLSLVESVASQRQKVKARVQRERPLMKQQIKKLAGVKLNHIRKESSENQSSEMFSKTNGKVKISLKKCNQYFSKVNPHGFSSFPPPLTQILPPFLIVSMISEIVVVSINFIADYRSYVIFAVMTLLIVPIVYYWFITTSISPTDSIQLQHLCYIQNPSVYSFQPEKHKYFCNLCKTCISQKSFHCNRCNRCVQFFDHHCKWLNNCIGSKNYVEFIQLVVWSEFFMFFFYACNTVVIVKICGQYETLPKQLWYVVSMIAISIVPFIAISMLLFLHIYLIIAKRKTIELILQNRRKNRIHPQKSNNYLNSNNQVKNVSNPVPEESPLASPTLIKQNSVLKEMNGQNNESLIKFMTNLTNNLRVKESLKAKQQYSRQNQQTRDVFVERKINFKPTILKKTTTFARNDFKSSTLKPVKIQSEFKQIKETRSKQRSNKKQKQVSHFDSDADVQDTSKNLMTKLRFSTKNQILDEPFQATTSQKTDRQPAKSFTERPQYHQNSRQSHSEKLQPLNKNLTEKKIKFKTKVETFEKENIIQAKQLIQINFQRTQLDKNSKRQQRNKKKTQSLEKPKSTRLFKVFAVQNRQSEDN